MNYCEYDNSNNSYYCDWSNEFFSSLADCYSNCAYYTINNSKLYLSLSEFQFLSALFGILLGAAFLFAYYKSLIS